MEIRHTKPADMDAVLGPLRFSPLFHGGKRKSRSMGKRLSWRRQLSLDMASGRSLCLRGRKRHRRHLLLCLGRRAKLFTGLTVAVGFNDRPYGVVHRITSAPGTRGVASFCLAWCFAQCGNIRIDTHRNNIPMQKTLIKNGYRVCGTIYLENGDERIAFQKEQEN